MTDTPQHDTNQLLTAAPDSDASAETHGQATARAFEMIATVDRLIDVLERETALLQRPRSAELAPVVSEKQAIFTEYEQAVARWGDLRALLAELTPELKEQVIAKARALEAALRENEMRLDAMMRASQSIMDVMQKVARKAARPIQGYGQAGTLRAPGKTSAPVAINRTL